MFTALAMKTFLVLLECYLDSRLQKSFLKRHSSQETSVGDNVLGARVKVGDFVRVGDELVGVLVVGVEVVGESDVGAFEVGECVIGDCVGADVSEQLAPKYPMLHIHTHCPFE